MTLTPRFPPLEPAAIHHLAVSPLHTLYIEEIGNPNGKPVIYLHGGPGVGILPHYRRFFDPELFHGFLFSQRGAFPSTPVGDITENNTWHLVEDIEAIRQHFGIEQWIVFGGSWGSTLALTYALKHAERVSALVLRGIYLGSKRENDWLYKDGGVSRIFPEAWQDFIASIPEWERPDIVAAYHRRIFDPDVKIHLPAAWAWVTWEDRIGTLLPAEPTPFTDESALAMARIECHYMYSHLFFERDDYLLQEAPKLAGIPTHIVQGRYDMICPCETVFALAEKLPQAKLHIVPDAGHSGSEPGTASELINALAELNQTLDGKI